MMKNIAIVSLLGVIGYQWLFVNASSAAPFVFNTQPLWSIAHLEPRPFLELGEDSVTFYHHRGWTIRCLEVDPDRGIVQPNYESPECSKPQ